MTWAVPHLMTAQQVADRLGATSVRTVARLRAAGRIPGVRVGREFRYHPDDVNRYIDAERAGVPHD